jgi:hypothetical protein
MSAERNQENNSEVDHKKTQHNIKVENFRYIICLPFYIENKSSPVGGKSEVSLAEIKDLLDKSGEWEVFDKLPRKNDKVSDKVRKYQARAYFHPFVQRFLYDENRLLRYKRKGDIQLYVQLLDGYKDNAKIHTILLEVEQCELSVFMPNIGILMLKVKHDVGVPLNIAQKISDELRRIYPPYFDEWSSFVFNDSLKDIIPESIIKYEKDNNKLSLIRSGHCPLSVQLIINDNKFKENKSVFHSVKEDINNTDLIDKYAKYFENGSDQGLVHPWESHWRTLLQPFSTDNNGQGLVIKQFGDDRAATMSYLAVDDLKLINRGNWVRLCFSDEPGNNVLPYAANFLKNFEEQYCYDRYWYQGEAFDSGYSPSRILNCGYSFSYIGSKNCDFFTNENNGALATFNFIYSDMGMIAHFQRAVLLSFSQRLSELVTRDKAGKIMLPDNDAVQNMYRQFIEFTQNYWFDEISPQEQGQQLFSMWRKHLRIQELYDEVHQELKDLVDYVELLEEKRAATASEKLNITVMYFGALSILFAIISTFSGVFGMNPDDKFIFLGFVPYSIHVYQTVFIVLVILLLVLFVARIWTDRKFYKDFFK